MAQSRIVLSVTPSNSASLGGDKADSGSVAEISEAPVVPDLAVIYEKASYSLRPETGKEKSTSQLVKDPENPSGITA